MSDFTDHPFDTKRVARWSSNSGWVVPRRKGRSIVHRADESTSKRCPQTRFA